MIRVTSVRLNLFRNMNSREYQDSLAPVIRHYQQNVDKKITVALLEFAMHLI